RLKLIFSPIGLSGPQAKHLVASSKIISVILPPCITSSFYI
ncbi:MAG: hypothetical protein ACI8XI_000986, partial [Woeseiaceae bacterium]